MRAVDWFLFTIMIRSMHVHPVAFFGESGLSMVGFHFLYFITMRGQGFFL